MQIKLKKLVLQNFKGCKDRTVTFGDKTNILGANATGKTTVQDGFMWLLFDKDSTGANKFQIRPLDSEGVQVDFVEIMVEGTLEIDGKKVVLKKVQKQNWVKDRSTQEQKFKGNINEFEVDGYPKLEKDYREYISNIVDEDLFKMITNPQTFTSLSWKKQREVLMKLCPEVLDIEIAQEDSRFSVLIPELERATTDDIHKKYTKALNSWKKKQIELPARIDEISKQIVEVDMTELQQKALDLREQIDDTELMYEDAGSAIKEYDEVSDRIIQIKGKLEDIIGKANKSLLCERKRIQDTIDEAQKEFNSVRQRIKRIEFDIQRRNDSIERNESEKMRLLDNWKKEKDKIFPEYQALIEINNNDLICPTCGQELPEQVKRARIEAHEENKKKHRTEYEIEKKKFLDNQENILDEIVQNGNAVVELIQKDKAEIEELEAQLKKAKDDSLKLNKAEADARKELSNSPILPDLSDNQEYESLLLQLSNLKDTLRNMDTGANYRKQLKIKLSGLREELAMLEKEIASADNSSAERRIEDLKKEQREVSQNVADQEKMIDLLDQFIRKKMSYISKGINDRFNMVSWKLFDTQINGGIKETCECTINGVSYSDLNNGHKIIAGLDIISSLSALYGVSAPIFIDNAEALNDFNIPAMDCQMVLLKVSEDKELIIRNE